MKVVILAGGFGTRLSEETDIKPKPMVEIGGKPILWHIMKIYSKYGYNEFIICCGYKGYAIKEYFISYYNHTCDITVNLKSGNLKVHKSNAEDWKVTLVDTGLNTLTGGRIKRIKDYIGNEPFLLTYGDGVADINIEKLVEFHKLNKKLVTVTSVQPSGRFGALDIGGNDEVFNFVEKPAGDGAWINGGFFVCEPQVFSYLKDDYTIWEKEPLQQLARDGQLMAYKHYGFWKPMDMLRDKIELDNLWNTGKAPWKIWD
ncbi:Glucose-1-phosphate cytidylyltransferase [uncultured Clostridium sp.]|uniref:glucose-1-phosphate cytidylyltransferase n=1 Tax=uncultured Clostridium sp. TaxID=59620 RepID=UPI0008219941|nr:glucose-1-phosphate cytidylyltransferase [uncultured Clostridium sp.]SCJ73216.1 Glucose-1-phosphate cytidylyltransferase [uncultured Clostridium sp.]